MSKAENIKGFRAFFQEEMCFPWKACDRQNRFASSNLALSAENEIQ